MVDDESVEGFRLSGDPRLLNKDLVHRWISKDTYWGAGRSRETMDLAIANSEPVGIYRTSDSRQVAFARVVTDGVVFAYLSDVYVDPEFRGQGLGRWLVTVLRDDLKARGLSRFLLATTTAQGVYTKLGFESIDPQRWMLNDLKAE
jgi:predicted GNAT family acetyltransferase